MNKHLRPTIVALLALVPFLFNTGLQVSGFSNATVTAICWIVAALILLLAAADGVRGWHLARLKQGSPGVQTFHFLLIGIGGTWLFLTLALGSAGWMIWNQRGFTIGASPIGVGAKANEGPLEWFKNLTMEGGPPLGRNVFSLTFRGFNSSQKEVELKNASIISAINGARVLLEIIADKEIVPLDQIELVPPGAPLQLVAKFGPPDPNNPGKILGLEPKVFLETWRQFSLNVADDQKSYRVNFNEGDLAPFFPGMVGPHVTKKVR